MNVLAVDQGTSSTKALVIAAGGLVLGEGLAPVTPRPSADGAVAQDAEELLKSIIARGRAAVRASGRRAARSGRRNRQSG